MKFLSPFFGNNRTQMSKRPFYSVAKEVLDIHNKSIILKRAMNTFADQVETLVTSNDVSKANNSNVPSIPNAHTFKLHINFLRNSLSEIEDLIIKLREKDNEK